LAIVAVCLALLSAILIPVWDSWNDDNMVAGFYEQPNNTIEVAFLGASTTASGISTVDMLQDYNLSSYSFGTGHEPLVSSYYWLKEVHRLHGGSLKVAVLDPAAMFYTEGQTNRSDFAVKATGHMQMSPVKLEMLWEYSQHYPDVDFIENIIPAIRYHSRWEELNAKDFNFIFGKGLNTESHGQNMLFEVSAGNVDDKNLLVPTSGITAEQGKKTEDLLAQCQSYNVEILDKFVEFCNQNNIELVFAVLPHKDWSDDKHDAVQAYANENGLLFTDLNFLEAQEEMGLYPPLDYSDANHANVSGARKLTRYIGDFLAENGITGTSDNSSLRTSLSSKIELYNDEVKGIEFPWCTSFDEYLSLCANENYVVLVSSRGDAAAGLSEKSRKGLKSLGLKKLASKEEVASYCAVIDGGEALVESISEDPSKRAAIECSFEEGVLQYSKGQDPSPSSSSFLGVYSFTADSGGKAVFKYQGQTWGHDKEGLNFVVIDRRTGTVVDTCCFNTCTDSKRTTDLVPASYDNTIKKLKGGA